MTVKYHNNGIWIEKMNETDYRIGLSEKGQDDVGEVMFVEITENDGKLEQGEAFLNVEGAKAVTEITLPFSASVKETHKELEDEPALLNKEDKAENWIITVTGVDASVWESLDTDLAFDKEAEA
ncbi:glycine cleavage system protein H [Alkalibacterium sp. f15]|uniref:glycine cleavage system protein H n=1 Tax=Alkalibacterium sp. f15 TaxID=3414029 RepID=UPI003BF8A2E8